MLKIETHAQRRAKSQIRREFHEALGFNLRKRQFSALEQLHVLGVMRIAGCSGWTAVYALDNTNWRGTDACWALIFSKENNCKGGRL
jgi:hypothetical protein